MTDPYTELHALGPSRPYEPPLPIPSAGVALVRMERGRIPHHSPTYRLFQLYVIGEWPRGSVTFVEVPVSRVSELEESMRELAG